MKRSKSDTPLVYTDLFRGVSSGSLDSRRATLSHLWKEDFEEGEKEKEKDEKEGRDKEKEELDSENQGSAGEGRPVEVEV